MEIELAVLAENPPSPISNGNSRPTILNRMKKTFTSRIPTRNTRRSHRRISNQVKQLFTQLFTFSSPPSRIPNRDSLPNRTWRRISKQVKQLFTFSPTFLLKESDSPPHTLYLRMNRWGRTPFIWVFTRISDTKFWFLFCSVLYPLLIWASTFRYRLYLFKYPFLGAAAFFAVVYYGGLFLAFKHVHEFRLHDSSRFIRNNYPWSMKIIGLLVLGLCNSSYLWLPETVGIGYALVMLCLIMFATAVLLVLRPSSDFNFINGLLCALGLYGIKMRKSYPGYGPYVIGLGCLLVGGFKFYYEAMVAEFTVDNPHAAEGPEDAEDFGLDILFAAV